MAEAADCCMPKFTKDLTSPFERNNNLAVPVNPSPEGEGKIGQ